MNESETTLEYFTDDELVNELHRRWSCLVVCMLRDTLSGENEEHQSYFRGGRIRSIGLLRQIEYDLMNTPKVRTAPPIDDQ